jgi:hypothetical protein
VPFGDAFGVIVAIFSAAPQRAAKCGVHIVWHYGNPFARRNVNARPTLSRNLFDVIRKRHQSLPHLNGPVIAQRAMSAKMLTPTKSRVPDSGSTIHATIMPNHVNDEALMSNAMSRRCFTVCPFVSLQLTMPPRLPRLPLGQPA